MKIKLTPEHALIGSLEDFHNVGWTDEGLLKAGHAVPIFSVDEWVWTTHHGWSQLQENTFDDQYKLMVKDKTFSESGFEYKDDKHPSLFTFDPLHGTEHPVETPAHPNMQWFINTTLGEKFAEDNIKPNLTDTFELEGILDAIDFNSTMRDLIADGYGNMRGGQMSDGTWFLSGNKI